MARVSIDTIVLTSAGAPISGGTAQVNIRAAGAATVYAAATGGTTLTNPLTPSQGTITGWLEPGSYDLVITNGGAPRTVPFEAVGGLVEARVTLLESDGGPIKTAETQVGTLIAPTEKQTWRFQPRDPAKAPFTWHFHGATFNSTWDTVMYLGYNSSGAGGRVVATEPNFTWNIEQDYEVSAGEHWLESYFEWTSPNPAGTVSTTNASPTLTSPVLTSGKFTVGQAIKGAGIPTDAKVLTINGSGAPTAMTKNATATASGVAITSASSGRPLFLRFDRTTGDVVGFEMISKSVTFTDWDVQSNIYATIYRSGMNLGSSTNDRDITLQLLAPTGRAGYFLMQYGGSTAIAFSPLSATETSIAIGGVGTMWLFTAGGGGRVSVGIESNAAALTVQDVGGGETFVSRDGPSGQTGDHYRATNAAGSTIYWSVGAGGIPRWNIAANQQTTVGAAGGASALPATPAKYLKVKDSAGTTYVIPAYTP